MEKKIERGIIYGMYPALILEDNNPEELLYNLAESYLYKDIFRWFQIRKPELLDKLLKALSLQLGNEVSYSELASLLKVKSETVSTYIQLLEKSFVIFRLGSFSRNLRTELKKSQKFYFQES